MSSEAVFYTYMYNIASSNNPIYSLACSASVLMAFDAKYSAILATLSDYDIAVKN